MATDYYETLDITPDASRDEIKRAWRRRARATHPDTGENGGNAEEFRAVQEAWETLGDDDKRASYDRVRIRLTSNPFNSDTGAAPQQQPFNGQNPSYFQTSSAFFSEQAGDRIRQEANKLFEEVLRRQRMEREQEAELAELGKPIFPLQATQWGHRLSRLYVEAHLWGTPLTLLRHWKRIDAVLINVFIALMVLADLGFIFLTVATSTTDTVGTGLLKTVMYEAILDLVALFLGFVGGAIAWIYRWTKHSGLRSNRP